MQKFANSIFTSVAYHDRMIIMFGPLNHFSIEAAGLDPEGLKTVGAGGGEHWLPKTCIERCKPREGESMRGGFPA